MTIDSTWRTTLLTDRQQKELAFAELYMRDFNHGATGHNLYVLADRLALLLDVATGVREMPAPPEGGDLVLTFGKYNGQALSAVYVRDPGYVEWLSREGRDPDVRAAAAALLTPAPAGQPADETAADGDLPF
jgi:hypothetical protein